MNSSSSKLVGLLLRDRLMLANGCFANNFISRRNVHHHKEWEIDKELYLGWKRSNPAKANRNAHMNERMFRKLRGAKTVRVELPDDVERREQDKMSPDELRIAMLRKGHNPYKDVSPREWNEHQLSLQSFYTIVDTYVPQEKKLWASGIKSAGMAVKDGAKNKFNNWWHGLRRIKSKSGFEKFSSKTFGPIAEEVYVSAFKALVERNKPLLHKYITEHAFVKLWPDVENGTVVWELIRFVEPSRVVSIRCVDNPPDSGNDVAQVTVRMHSEQKLAIYDRFGHILLGSETDIKPCLEYVVFENHIASVDGRWRFHDKVHPHWLKPKQSILKTGLLDQGKQKLEPTPLKLDYSEKLKERQKKIQEREKLDGKRSA